MMTAGLPITVAVVSWNTRELLSACLVSLAADAETGLAEVWVVDNASSDGSAEMVRDRFPWATLVSSPNNLGFGSAVNQVARRTASSWLAVANADIRVTPGALECLLTMGEQHSRAAVIAPRLVLPDGSTQHSAYPFPTLKFTVAYVLALHRLSARLADRWCVGEGWHAGPDREVPWAIGAFLLVRRSAWDEVGGFDDRQWMYAEDLDLGWRLHRAGWTARYCRDAVVHHEESAAVKQAWGDERHVQWHASTYAWLLRRRGGLAMRLIAAVNVVGFFVRAMLFTIATLAGVERARAARRDALNAARAHAVGLGSREVIARHR